MKTTMTREMTDAMTEEYRQLMDAALKQLEEHKVWLKEQLYAHMHAREGGEWKLAFRVIIDQVDEITLEAVRSEPKVKQLVKENDQMVEKPTLSIIYEYPDELYAFLTHPDAPQHLRSTLYNANAEGLDKASFTLSKEPS